MFKGGKKPDDKVIDAYHERMQTIMVQVIDTADRAALEAVWVWLTQNKEKVDDILLIDKEKLEEVLRLGIAEYNKIHDGE